jgi:hypothetical protein
MVSKEFQTKQSHRDIQHTRAGRHFGGIIVRHLSDMKGKSLLWATVGCDLAERCIR